jgi:hypothetical protein
MRSESKNSADGFQAGDSTLMVDATGTLADGFRTWVSNGSTRTFQDCSCLVKQARPGGQKERTTRCYGVFAYNLVNKNTQQLGFCSTGFNTGSFSIRGRTLKFPSLLVRAEYHCLKS